MKSITANFSQGERVTALASGRNSRTSTSLGRQSGELKFSNYTVLASGRFAVFTSTQADQMACDGDSGGGVFVKRDGKLMLAGVLSLGDISLERKKTLSESELNKVKNSSDGDFCMKYVDHVKVIPLSDFKAWIENK